MMPPGRDAQDVRPVLPVRHLSTSTRAHLPTGNWNPSRRLRPDPSVLLVAVAAPPALPFTSRLPSSLRVSGSWAMGMGVADVLTELGSMMAKAPQDASLVAYTTPETPSGAP